MKLSAIEKQVVSNMHLLPLDKQQVILELSAFFKNKAQEKQHKNNSQSFGELLKEFRKEIEEEQLDIDTSIFDIDRHAYIEREIEL